MKLVKDTRFDRLEGPNMFRQKFDYFSRNPWTGWPITLQFCC